MSDLKVFDYNDAVFTDHVESGRLGPKTRGLYEHLMSRVLGQERASRHLARSFSVHYAGLKDPTKPIGVFLFAGPTGVGKTFLAEEIARYLIADVPDAPLTLVDCGGFTESHRVSQLIGSPPGYIGSDMSPGLAQRNIDEPHFRVKAKDLFLNGLTVAQRKKNMAELMEEFYQNNGPYFSVILFDEIEKAHSNLHDALLNMMDKGKLNLPHNQTTSFAHSVIILTCNVGGEEQQRVLSGKGRQIGFDPRVRSEEEELEDIDKRIYEQTLASIERKFRPEFVARIRSNIVVFRTLTREQSKKVLENMLQDVQKRILQNEASIPILIVYSAEFKEFLLNEGVDRVNGLRKLGKTVERHVIAHLANAIESGALQPGDEVLFKLQDKQPVLYRKPRSVVALLTSGKEKEDDECDNEIEKALPRRRKSRPGPLTKK